MKKWLALPLSIVLPIGLLAGCSDGRTNAGVNDNEKSSGGQVTIKMTISGSDQEMKLRKETAELFMKQHPNIKIDWVDIGKDRYQKTLTLIAGGDAPDILYINDWVAPLAQKGVLKPLDEFIKSDPDFKVDQFYPSVIDALKLEGKLYALPQEISPIVIYYNKDLFDKAGVPYPTSSWTQDDFLNVAKKLSIPEKKQYGFVLSNGLTYWGGWMLRNGNNVFTPDFKKSGFGTPETLKSLQTIKKMVVDDHLTPNTAEVTAMGQGTDALFRNQQVAMIEAGLWYLPPFKSELLPFKWDVVMQPKGVNQNVKAGVLNWGMSAKTKHPKEAWEVLKFFEGHEGMMIVAKYNMALPATTDKEANQLIIDSKFPENVKAFVDSAPLINMDEFRHPKWAEIHQAVKEQMDLLMLGKQAPEAIQKNIVTNMNQIMGE
ncbi:multiple sugar transport system substrate-binding protein [Paenibacillus sp. 1_12]|uniref:ABC transporter substrate-binding protein n=1 Tax=Paenibacillus sp. 1_12 TaxID=1566278 RepID=UPI0008F330E9|nr:sugar ABC transporter substrate-binding protein [Paenibacillus sp. 1_12]SFM38928.1 multiple sugar transport system substrate-binding protein [Paenibacillus sp. 1_12]